MSDIPEGNICKVSANLGWASDTLAMVEKTMLKLSAEVKTILRERDNFQDQRDFAMSEIERLRKEYFEMLDSAWGLIANAGGGNWDLQTEEWRQAARRWRDKYLSTPASKEEKEAAK